MYYEQLKAGVLQHDLLVDNLIYKVLSSTPTGTTFTAKTLLPFYMIVKFSVIVL